MITSFLTGIAVFAVMIGGLMIAVFIVWILYYMNYYLHLLLNQ
jgi:hypothetical protein